MKHLYLMLTVMLYCIATTAQTRYWVGPATGGNWNDASNWSTTSGTGSGATVPNAGTFDVVFDENTEVNVDITSFSLNTLTVTNGVKVRLFTGATGSTITLNSTDANAPGLKVDAGSTLEDSCSTNSTVFQVQLNGGAKGAINGIWTLLGNGSGYAYGSIATTTGTKMTVNGTIKLGNDLTYFDCTVNDNLEFKAGSVYQINRNAGTTPSATWDAASTILVTGSRNFAPTINLPGTGAAIGNLVYDCPGVTGDFALQLTNGLKIGGSLKFLNTNGYTLTAGYSVAGPVTYTVMGNLEIGPNANIIFAPNAGYAYTMQVNGNYVQTGGSLNMRATAGTVTLPVTLGIGGNVSQTAGSFGNTNLTTSTSTELFVVELNGTTNQSVSFASGTIDNSVNQVVLRMNNAAGATLTAPLSVGKLSWNSTNKGNLTTSSSGLLTINNSSATDALVVNGPSSAGYVNGPLVRKTASNVLYSFPTGKGGVYRACEVRPTATTASSYEAEYFATAYTDLSVVSPLSGVSNQEYWDISKVSGSDAVVRLTLAAAVPGASATDVLLVAHYNGADWERVDGTTLSPGTVSSGSVESDTLSSFSPFTFGYFPAAILPVFLVNFTARKEGTTGKLNWTITENSTPKRFEVTRSTDGSNFSKIGVVGAADGELGYDYTDMTLPSGTIYYRLKMVDVNEAVQYSKIVAIVNGAKGFVITSMQPTIVTTSARLDVSAAQSGTIRLVVTDIQGRIVQQQTNSFAAGSQQITLNLGGLVNGTYQVTGYLSTGERTTTIRFIKQ